MFILLRGAGGVDLMVPHSGHAPMYAAELVFVILAETHSKLC